MALNALRDAEVAKRRADSDVRRKRARGAEVRATADMVKVKRRLRASPHFGHWTDRSEQPDLLPDADKMPGLMDFNVQGLEIGKRRQASSFFFPSYRTW